MKVNFQPAINIVKKAGSCVLEGLCSVWNKISGVYGEYDVDIKSKTHLTPAELDDNGNEQNVVCGSYQGKLKISVKDAVRFLLIFFIIFSLVKAIIRRIFR